MMSKQLMDGTELDEAVMPSFPAGIELRLSTTDRHPKIGATVPTTPEASEIMKKYKIW